MDINRRAFLWTVGATLAACDRVVVDIRGGDDDITLDDQGNPFISPITSNEKFFVYQYGSQPDVVPASWSLSFTDDVQELGTVDLAFLEGLPARDVELTLQCIGASVVARRINNAVWTGLPLSEVLAAAGIEGPPPGTVEIRFRSPDNYHASVPVSDLEDAPIWLIWGMNGEPLPYAHGGPARLMIPGRYGVKNVKWITEIDWIDHIHENHWDPSGWSHSADYKVNGFIHLPVWDSTVSSPVQVLGTSFAGMDPVVKVELTDDGGDTWQDCEIVYAPGPNIWCLWELTWKPKEPGSYEIQIRVTTEGGQVSSMDPAGDLPLQGYNGGALIPLTVV